MIALIRAMFSGYLHTLDCARHPDRYMLVIQDDGGLRYVRR